MRCLFYFDGQKKTFVREVRDALKAGGYLKCKPSCHSARSLPTLAQDHTGRVEWYLENREWLEMDVADFHGTITFQCAIEQIADWYPRLFLEPHIVACVAVMNPYSAPPAVFEVECLNIASEWLGQATQFRLEVSWLNETARKAERLRLTMQAKPLVEMAATALALILTHQVVNLGQLDVMNYGDRADYRSLDVPGVLEISGTEVPSELARRHREKVAVEGVVSTHRTLALANPLGLDAYIVVCAFSENGHRIRFSYHRWKESQDE